MAGYFNPQQQQQFNYGNQMAMMQSTAMPQQMGSMMNQNQAFPTPQQMQMYQQQHQQQQQQQQQQQNQQYNMMYQQMSASQTQQQYNVGQQFQQQTNYPASSAVSMPNMYNTGYGGANYATSGYTQPQQMSNVQAVQASPNITPVAPYQMTGQSSSGMQGRLEQPSAPRPVPPPPPIAPPTTTSKPPPPPTGPTDSTQAAHVSSLNAHVKPEVLKALKENSSYQKMESERAEVVDKQQQFETQYDKWESDFQQWLLTNRNHPDQTQLTKYTEEHESYRLKLQAIREELKQSLAHVELRQKQLSEKVSRDVNTSNRYHQNVSPTKPSPMPSQSTAAIAQPVRYNAPAANPVVTQEGNTTSSFSGISQLIENERKMATQSMPANLPNMSTVSASNSKQMADQRFGPGDVSYSISGGERSYGNMQPKSSAPSNQFTQSYSEMPNSNYQAPYQYPNAGNVQASQRVRGAAPPPIRLQTSVNSSGPVGSGPSSFGRGVQRFPRPQLGHPQRFSQDQSSHWQNDFNEFEYSEDNYSESNADQTDVDFDSYPRVTPVSVPPRPPAIRSRNPLAKNSLNRGASVAPAPRMPAVRPAIRKPGPISGTGANTIPLATKAPWQQRGGGGAGVIKAPVSIDSENLTSSVANVSTSFSDDVNFDNLNFSNSKQSSDQTSKSHILTQSTSHVVTKPNVAISSFDFTADESDTNKTPSYKVVRTTPNAMRRGERGSFANRGSRGGANQNSFNLKAPPFLETQPSEQTPGETTDSKKLALTSSDSHVSKTHTTQSGFDTEVAENVEDADEGGTQLPAGKPQAGQQQGADLDLDVIKAALKSLVPADDEEDDDIERHFKASEIRNPQQVQRIRPQNPPWNPQRGGLPTRVVAIRSRGGLARGIPPQTPAFVSGVPQGPLHAVGGPRTAMQIRAPLQMRGRGGVIRGGVLPFGRGAGRGLPVVEPTGMMVGQNGNMLNSVAQSGIVQPLVETKIMGGGGVNGGTVGGGGGSVDVFCDMERYETEMEYKAWYDKFGKMYYKLHGPDIDPEREQEKQWEKEFFDRDHGPDPRHPFYPKWVSKHFGEEKGGKTVATSLAIDLNTPTLNDLITVPDPTELTDLIEFPGRRIRAPKIVLILRGPPGSGKSFLARLIKFFDRDHGPDPRHPFYPKWVSKHFGEEKGGKTVATSLAIDLNTPTLNDLITVPDPTELTDLIEFPGRRIRAPKIVLILRGPPGSGKSFLARLIKEREVILGDHQKPPRILTIDDYYLTEEFINKENAEEQRNAKITLPSAPRNKIVQYEYDEKMETAYNLCMFKCFKKSLEHDLFSFLVVDNINHLVSDFEQYLACAKLCGYKAYVVELKVPASLCFKRNTHKRSRKDVERIITTWEDPPEDCRCLEYNNFLEEHAEPEPVKEAAKSVGVEPKLHKRSLSPPLSSGGHRHRSDVKSARTVEPSPSILPTSSSGRAVTLDTILIDSRSPSPEQVVTDVAREESPLSFRPKHWSPRSGSRRGDKQPHQVVPTSTRSRGSSPGKRSLFPIKALSPSESKRSKYRREDPSVSAAGAAITLSPPSLRMVERQRTPSIERLLGKAIATVESLRSPKRDQKRAGSPVRRDRDRSRKHGDSGDVSKSQVEVVALDSPERISSSRRRSSRSKSPHKRSSGSSRTHRRSKSRSPDRYLGQSRRK